MKKMQKILNIILIAMILISVSLNVFAADDADAKKASGVSIDEITKAGSIDSDATTSLQKFGGTIIKYVTNAAMVISVVMIAVLGVKYMLGSAEEKSEYKKSLMPLLIGALLVFGAATVAKIIVGLAGSFSA